MRYQTPKLQQLSFTKKCEIDLNFIVFMKHKKYDFELKLGRKLPTYTMD
jgi:hypothetical protein